MPVAKVTLLLFSAVLRVVVEIVELAVTAVPEGVGIVPEPLVAMVILPGSNNQSPVLPCAAVVETFAPST